MLIGVTAVFFAAFFALSCSVSLPGIDGVPYCRLVIEGYTTDADGAIFNYGASMCVNNITDYWILPYAIFMNGQNTGRNASAAFKGNSFFSIHTYINGTKYGDGPGFGVVWDLGPSECNSGVGIIDGTFDAVDGALAIMFDGKPYGGDERANFTTTCSATTSSFTIGPDFLPKGLSVGRTFYFPLGPVEAWARVVDEVTNPQEWDVEVSIGYYNNAGGDSRTLFLNVTDRYTFINDDGYDNMFSLHFASINSTIPQGFFGSENIAPLLHDGNEDIQPYWNVTIPAGQTMTFMMLMNQGGFRNDVNEALMYAVVQDIDSNPLKLYSEMTENQLKTLYNFNPCATTVPQINNPSPSTPCTQFGGSAEFDLTTYLAETPLTVNVTVTLHNDDDSVAATSQGNTLSAAAGTYSAKLNYGPCALNVGTVTITCPDAPTVAPVTVPLADVPLSSPVATPTPVATPSRKVSSASTLIGCTVVLTAVALLFC